MSRYQAIDFLRPQGSRHPLRWGIFLAGAACLALSVQHYQAAEQVRAERQTQQQRAHQQALATLANASASRLLGMVPYAQDKRWQRAARELSRPWATLLPALEQATQPPIYLLNLRTDAATGRLQLEVEAPRLEEGLAYIDKLQTQGILLKPQLVAHDTAPDGQGTPAVRMTIQVEGVRP